MQETGHKPVDWKATRNTKAMPGIYHIGSVNTRQKHHQTEKPVELLKALLQICPSGGMVLDCFMGSGSTGVACVQEGRSFIGIELSEDYYETAKKRIQEAAEYIQQKLPLDNPLILRYDFSIKMKRRWRHGDNDTSAG